MKDVCRNETFTANACFFVSLITDIAFVLFRFEYTVHLQVRLVHALPLIRSTNKVSIKSRYQITVNNATIRSKHEIVNIGSLTMMSSTRKSTEIYIKRITISMTKHILKIKK